MRRKPRHQPAPWPPKTVPPLPHPSWFGYVRDNARVEPKDFWARLGI